MNTHPLAAISVIFPVFTFKFSDSKGCHVQKNHPTDLNASRASRPWGPRPLSNGKGASPMVESHNHILPILMIDFLSIAR